ncbi:T9SS type A sorting domain-containing protein [Bacteroidota bacterium]
MFIVSNVRNPGSAKEIHRVYFGITNPPDSVGEQTASTYQPGVLEPGSSYYWRIDEVNENGTTTGQMWKFLTKETTSSAGSISEPNKLPFDVYPNPVSGGIAYVEYLLVEPSEMTISIIDLYGRQIRTDRPGIQNPGFYRHKLSLEEVPDGAYLIMIHNGYSYKTVRIIVSAK